jgi:hypothetical protein
VVVLVMMMMMTGNREECAKRTTDESVINYLKMNARKIDTNTISVAPKSQKHAPKIITSPSWGGRERNSEQPSGGCCCCCR